MAGIAAKLAKDREAADGLGSHERAVKYLNQDYEELRNQCLEAGVLFQDPSFPAIASSLGFKELGPHSSKTRGIEWKRPTVGDAGLRARRVWGPRRRCQALGPGRSGWQGAGERRASLHRSPGAAARSAATGRIPAAAQPVTRCRRAGTLPGGPRPPTALRWTLPSAPISRPFYVRTSQKLG